MAKSNGIISMDNQPIFNVKCDIRGSLNKFLHSRFLLDFEAVYATLASDLEST
ncbi:hypothetical protein TOT_030000019 [Theileria orientalis strain Shintoku]|uniref:Uncharacterized protein n=1 Tax=Theileria orientalis strain Shintoku TaxID=869250 RepID=J4CD96_THEOR|nr:hypothetical protein TOT_030000019 [Theileria orientalis strain Shintoku]BAM40757.1 hypothetical protein TOT_030000019 [Theileria orientalis strain Shintoku]|eukprot:XP_009691058.1 hypothetical protein TOT_030000019 [Theileria orientalis strain Shintoku]